MKKEYNFKISEVWMRLILKLIKRMTSYLISRTTIVSRIVIQNQNWILILEILKSDAISERR